VLQTVGEAPASKGFHLADGHLDGQSYSAAVDLSVSGLTWTEIATWIEELCRAGFVPFYRYKGTFKRNRHIHANYAGVPMKESLRRQCRDFFQGLDGLVDHLAIDGDLYPSPELVAIPKRLFLKSNGKTPQVVTSPVVQIAERPANRGPNADTGKSVTYGLRFGSEVQPRFWMPVRDGVALAPVRAWGSALGLNVLWLPEKKKVLLDQYELPIALTTIAGVGHAPVRQLARFSGMHFSVDEKNRMVRVWNA
jgi:hypothetical protein